MDIDSPQMLPMRRWVMTEASGVRSSASLLPSAGARAGERVEEAEDEPSHG
jgi:hypothetical protein